MEPLIGLDFKNFQSLRNASIDLAPGLNVVVGPSNLGKSAAIRGLKALINNAAAPGLIRHGSKELSVTAWFADGQKIEVVKGKNKSEFRVNDNIFAKAGATSVPDAVAEIWNISDTALTFASQHDKPFY
jgi:exonuclease SbcC